MRPAHYRDIRLQLHIHNNPDSEGHTNGYPTTGPTPLGRLLSSLLSGPITSARFDCEDDEDGEAA